MTFALTVFYISFFALSALFVYKTRALRAGRMERAVHHATFGLDLPQVDIHETKKKVAHHAKRYTLSALLLISKLWLIAVHRVREMLERKYPRFAATFWHKRGELTESNSVFLRAITEYKMKMRHFKKRLQEQDKDEE